MRNEDILDSVLTILALDGSLNKWEVQFFNDICGRLDISKDAQHAAITRIKQGKGRIHLPENPADKNRLLYFLIQAVVADGKVHEKERHVLHTVVEKLGLSKVYVEEVLEQRLKEIKTERYTVQQAETIVCPKCGFEQSSSYRCKRCGIIFEKFKKIQTPEDEDEDRLRELLASSNTFKKT